MNSVEQACHGGTLYPHPLGKFFLTDIESLPCLFKYLKQGNVYANIVEIAVDVSFYSSVVCMKCGLMRVDRVIPVYIRFG